jgi:hypothetical protein
VAIGSKKQGAGAAENIDAIFRLERQEEQKLALHHRVLHKIGGFVGTRIARRLEVGDTPDCEADELADETSVDQIAQDLKAREEERIEQEVARRNID